MKHDQPISLKYSSSFGYCTMPMLVKLAVLILALHTRGVVAGRIPTSWQEGYPVFRPSDKAVLEKHCVQNIAQTKSIKEKRCRASARQEEISDRAQQKRHDLELQDDKTVFHLDYNSPRTHPPKNN
ncbi:hypothetical protein KP509_26G032500 [Ceratopteris richardii]|uniref:Uncharacterized protein n=1 Tax=Ceratopteris richardii TaxID=49495 RepID=A0A8T2RJS8_CERRI|nr:hypothetical protein KP509_26G032500 [Ceratopteris richardii]